MKKIALVLIFSKRTLFKNYGDTIQEENLKRIFKKFYCANSSRRTSTGNAGLGLAIAKEIIELHGGNIDAFSDNGETIFNVYLLL